MKKNLLYLFIIITLSGIIFPVHASYPYKKFRQNNLVILQNYSNAKRIADKEKVPMLTIFFLKWDTLSVKLFRFVKNERISKFLRDNFIVVAVDLWENKYDAHINQINNCPTIKIDYLRFKKHYRIKGEFNPESFLEFLAETLKIIKVPVHYPDDKPDEYPGYRNQGNIPSEGPKQTK